MDEIIKNDGIRKRFKKYRNPVRGTDIGKAQEGMQPCMTAACPDKNRCKQYRIKIDRANM